jgi:hypothetical protein
VAAGVVGVDQRVAAQAAEGADDAQRFDAPALFASRCVERRVPSRQQGGLDAGPGQSFDEAQHLPLAAAHLSSGIEMKDAHQLMFLALEYFRKV